MSLADAFSFHELALTKTKQRFARTQAQVDAELRKKITSCQMWMTQRQLGARTRSNVLRFYTQDWISTLSGEDHEILSALARHLCLQSLLSPALLLVAMVSAQVCASVRACSDVHFHFCTQAGVAPPSGGHHEIVIVHQQLLAATCFCLPFLLSPLGKLANTVVR